MSRKHVRRDRRRNERAMDEAFALLERGELPAALRTARRVRDAGAMNPRLLLDHAVIARAAGEPAEAVESLQAALALAPDYAAAWCELAALQFDGGRHAAAQRSLARALALAPDDREVLALAAEFARAAAASGHGDARSGNGSAPAPGGGPPTVPAAVAEPRLQAHDLAAAANSLTDRGHAVLPALLTPAECEALRAEYERAAAFDREIALHAADEGACTFRWCLRDLPPFLAALRAQMYPVCAGLVRDVWSRLGRPRALPGTLAAWRAARGRAAGNRPIVRVLQCAPGGFLARQRAEDPGAFPLRLLCDLGPGPERLASVLAVVDQRPGRKEHLSAASTSVGDAVVFGQRERLDRIAGVYGLQPVFWRLGPVAAPRCFLDLAFDDE